MEVYLVLTATAHQFSGTIILRRQFSLSFCWTARSTDAPRSISVESSDALLAEDEDSEHVDMSHCVKKQFASNVKICLCDSVDYFMHQSEYFVRRPLWAILVRSIITAVKNHCTFN